MLQKIRPVKFQWQIAERTINAMVNFLLSGTLLKLSLPRYG